MTDQNKKLFLSAVSSEFLAYRELLSGSGGFGFIDPATGRYESVTELPSFTRGIDFVGPLAFIGLSQVRASAVFSGIKIAERPTEERSCGV